jgi:phospho-N-acetylmuramoyl-pentapeptide-transferase
MLYHLFEWLREMDIRFPGGSLLQFINFTGIAGVILSLVISTLFGKKLINYLLKKQVGESVRDLGLHGEQQKKGTPTMGGLIIFLLS